MNRAMLGRCDEFGPLAVCQRLIVLLCGERLQDAGCHGQRWDRIAEVAVRR